MMTTAIVTALARLDARVDLVATSAAALFTGQLAGLLAVRA